MKSWKRLSFYLVLNVLVSACTTLGVLFAWDQLYGPLPRGLLPRLFSSSSAAAVEPTAAPPGAGEPQLRPTPTEVYEVYQVRSGDTFESIAAANNISVDELIAVNGFTQSQPLGEGEVLRIPQRTAGSVVIDSVIGAGDLALEHVMLKHSGGGEISLTGWRLEDGKGSVFIFPDAPQLTLYAGGAVNIYTNAGVNTVIELHWGLEQSIWSSGSTVILRDAQGNVQARYLVP
ncbi:MAG: lamin tail domain-containing protein [Chloroflexota bacterium]